MRTKPLILLVAILALSSLACGVSFNLPLTDVKTGPTQTDEINVPLSGSSLPTDLTIAFGAGELHIRPGAANSVVEGTARYNVTDLKPDVVVNGNSVRIETGDFEIGGIPRFNDEFVNQWNLQLGDTPMNLTINSGAYKGDIDLGALSLQSLEVSDGAAEVDLRFSELNHEKMDILRYQTGASKVSLRGLANANTDQMIFKGGAGEYTLDFSGNLQQDLDVNIDAGMSSLEVIVPQGVPVKLFYDGGLANVNLSGDWQQSGTEYYQDGSGPSITIDINLGAGNLRLRNR